jgi:hypothetical protein
MTVPNTPLFVKTHDLTVWMLQHTQRFPKDLRHSHTVRLENACFDFQEQLLLANACRGKDRQARLESADAKLLHPARNLSVCSAEKISPLRAMTTS